MSVLTNINTKGITYNHQNPWEHLSEVATGLSGLGKVGDAVASYGKHKGLQDAYDAVNEMRRLDNDLEEVGKLRDQHNANQAELKSLHDAEQDAAEEEWNQTHQYKSSGKLSNEGLDKNGIKELQAKLGVTADGIWGDKSQKALDAYNANAKPEIKKTMLGYLDGDFQRKEYEPEAFADEEYYQMLKSEHDNNQGKLMEYALVMKSLGDSSLYDELVSKRNYEQTERNNKAIQDEKAKEAANKAVTDGLTVKYNELSGELYLALKNNDMKKAADIANQISSNPDFVKYGIYDGSDWKSIVEASTEAAKRIKKTQEELAAKKGKEDKFNNRFGGNG